MDSLREGIHLRALGQKDPLSEYKIEGGEIFDEMMASVRQEFVRYMFHMEVETAPEVESHQPEHVDYSYADDPMQGYGAVESEASAVAVADPVDTEQEEAAPLVEQRRTDEWDRVGRNDPCPCGSGQKYKKCHGA